MKKMTSAARDFVLRHDRVLAFNLLALETICERKIKKHEKYHPIFRRPFQIAHNYSKKYAFLRSDEDVSFDLMTELLLCKILDNFSSYLVDLAGLVLSKHALRFSHVFSSYSLADNIPQRDSLQQQIEKRVDELTFYGFRRLSEFYDKSFGMPLLTSNADFDFLIKVYEIRNCIVHYDGIVSTISAKRCKELSTAIGQRIPLSYDDLTDSRKRIERIFFEIDDRFIKNFELPALLRSGV